MKSSNLYRHAFEARCPANDLPVRYDLEIEAREMIRVEAIVEACAKHKSEYHEAIADDLIAKFGGRQVLRAHHHGVDIETRRGG